MRLNMTLVPLFAILLVLSVTAILPSGFSAEQQPWVKFSGNPVLAPTPGSWDGDSLVQPRVIYDGNNYKMWYVGSRQGVRAIGYAESIDGVTWKKHATPVLTTGPQGSWDATEIGLGSVDWNGTQYLMWYRGVSPNFVSGAIGLALSNNGTTWVKYSGNPVLRPSTVDLKFIGSPYVLRSSSLYNMWYSARAQDDPSTSQIQRILYANSFDGVHWDKFTGSPKVALQPATGADDWDSGSVFSPSVYFDGSNYGMWYSALNQTFLEPRIGFAASKDAITWTRFSGNPVLSPSPSGSWDSAGVENPNVIAGQLGFMLFYDGIGETSTGSIGFAQPPTGFEVPEFNQSLLLLGAVMLVVVSLVKRNLGKKA